MQGVGWGRGGPVRGEHCEHFVAKADVAAITSAEDVDGAIFASESCPVEEMGGGREFRATDGFDADFLEDVFSEVKVASDTGDESGQGQAFGEQDGGDFLGGKHV